MKDLRKELNVLIKKLDNVDSEIMMIKSKIDSCDDHDEKHDDVKSPLKSRSFQSKLLKKQMININNATERELRKLPGFSFELIKRIIEYRENHGYFDDIVDIKDIFNIADEHFDSIKHQMCI